MLIEFRVRNFRSLRDEQVFSMVAAKDASHAATHTHATGIDAVPRLLRTAVLYGPNAGGKSNLIKALQYMRAVVVESASLVQPGQLYVVQGFRLDDATAAAPTEFELTFLVGGIRHQYGFSMTPERIVSEHLLVYKAFKPQQWFARRFDAETGRDVYEFGAGLKGQKSVWEAATRPNALFLSMAAQLNSEQLRPVFDWFAMQLSVHNEINTITPARTIAMLMDPAQREAVVTLVRTADFGVVDIEVAPRKVSGKRVNVDFVADKAEVLTEEAEEREVRFHHAGPAGRVSFKMDEESAGTRNFLCAIGPWLDALQRGGVIVVDEIDASLHTLLVRKLVALFYDNAFNSAGAQLVFSTHDTSLLDADGLFRRDQVWFVEKGEDQASALHALSDFSPRKNEALGRGYLTGRYGGLPLLEQMELEG